LTPEASRPRFGLILEFQGHSIEEEVSMKRTLTAFAAALVAVAMVRGSASAQAKAEKPAAKPAAATASAEEELIKIEKERAAAAVKGDTAVIDKYTAADYTFITRNGQLADKTETLNRLKTGDIKLTANDVSDIKVRLYGTTAVVTGKTDVKGTMGGKDYSGPVLFTRV
jgi:endonuclease YncB( thermonuclease family)